MIRTGEQYRDSIRDGGQVSINGKRVANVTTHKMFKPLVDIRAGINDMAYETQYYAAVIRATTHRYSAFAGVRRNLGLRRPQPDASVVRSVAAVREPRRRLPRFRLGTFVAHGA